RSVVMRIPPMFSSSWRPKKKSSPRCCAAVSRLSRLRTGFGGGTTDSMKSLNACIWAGVMVPPTAVQAVERDDEVLERQLLVERVLGSRVVRVGVEEAGRAVAAPVHRPVGAEAAQRLRGH